MDNTTLYNNERLEKILDIIRSQHSVSVNYLADYFHVSGATIRTDLSRLENKGDIIRTHGGATIKSAIYHEQLINERLHDDLKMLIANQALAQVGENDTILIDTGTTMLFFAQALVRSSISRLKIYTNDIEVARILEAKEEFDIHLLGGKMRNGFHYCYGHQLIEELKNYHFEKLFVAASAIDIERGLTIYNSDLAQMKAAMIDSSKTVILLADSSKAELVDFQTFADINSVDVLIMDSGVPPLYVQKLKEHIANIVLA